MPRELPRADANEQVRLLRNKLHNVEQDLVLPLRQRVAELERDVANLTSEAAQSRRQASLYRAAAAANAALVGELLASGKIA